MEVGKAFGDECPSFLDIRRDRLLTVHHFFEAIRFHFQNLGYRVKWNVLKPGEENPQKGSPLNSGNALLVPKSRSAALEQLVGNSRSSIATITEQPIA
jgi:hypothetical protein